MGGSYTFAAGLNVNILSTTELVKEHALLVRVEIEGFDFSYIKKI